MSGRPHRSVDPKTREEVASAVIRARANLDLALARRESLAEDDRQRFSYSVHALNNYLMVVATTLQLLRKKLAVKEDREVKRWLDSLKQATSLMMSTARGVLTATPDALPPLLFERASLVEIADGVCSAYREIARNKHVRIAWKAPAKRDRVLTDRVAAGAVLDNLLSNAVKYSEAGQAILVKVAIHSEEVLCSVCDHGPGLSEKDQARLFQRGVTLTSQPTGGETATGYGLAIANDLAKALGGRLSCTSALGQGSVFTFFLPIAKPGDPFDETGGGELPTLPLERGSTTVSGTQLEISG
jgi:two-component system, sensor histidine kinase and response regulator